MVKKIKLILISFLIAISMMIGITTIFADDTDDGAADTEEYFNTGRTGGVKANTSDDIRKINTIGTVVPSQYSFTLGKTFTNVSFHINDSWKLSESEKRTLDIDGTHDNWVKTYDGSSLVNTDEIPGNYWAVYENAGTYKGISVDVKATIMKYKTFRTSGQPSTLAIRNDSIGVQVRGINWVKVKYDFYKHGTVDSSTGVGESITVKGYSTYWDIDVYQGIHFLDGDPTLYASTEDLVYYNKINGKPYIYNQSNEQLGQSLASTESSYDNKGTITETFTGSTITRVFSFSRPNPSGSQTTIWKANGTILNTAIVDGAIKEYANDTAAGMDGSQVQVGDKITYKITMTNGYEDESSASVTVTDNLSKGLKYVAGSAKIGNSSVADPSGSPYVDSGQTLTWNNITSIPSGGTKVLTYVVEVTEAAVQKVNNNATIKIGNHTYTGSLTNPVPNVDPVKSYASDTPSGNNHSAVKVGDIIKYSIKLPSNNIEHDQTITVLDVLSKGLTYNNDAAVSGGTLSSTETPVVNPNKTTNLGLTVTVPAGQTATLTYSVKVTKDAVNIVNNTATADYGNGPIAIGELKNPVPVKEYGGTSASDNGGWNHNAVVKGKTIKYKVTLPNIKNETLTVTVSDILSKGLTYNNDATVSGGTLSNATTSGSNPTTLTLTISIPAGDTATLTYSAKVNNDAINIVDNKATANYGNGPIVIGELKNPVPVKEYAGSSINDNPGWNHHEVKTGKDIKYKVTLPNIKDEALRIVVSDVLSKGLTYNNDAAISGGTITSAVEPSINNDTKMTSLEFIITVPAGQIATLTYSAKVNNDAINLVNNMATANYGNGPVAIGELNNPVPRKAYDVDTASGMNGKIVQKDDVITYNIGYSNGYLVPATINLRDTLSKGLSYKKGSAKVCDLNKTNCSTLEEKGITEKVIVKTDGKTEIYWTRNNMPSLGIEIIVYDVAVTGETIKVNNDFDIKICKETEATTQTETIQNCEEQTNKQCAPICNPASDSNCKTETDSECASTKQECSITGMMCNSEWIDIEELHNPVPEKKYDDKTPSGFNHTGVVKDNKIRYEIRYTNVADTMVTVKVTDTISNGIKYVKGTSKVNGVKIEDPVLSNNDKTLTWTRQMEKGKEESLTYEVIVTGETIKVKNKATITYSNNPDDEKYLNELENPVPVKAYSKNTKAGANGARVQKNDVITYSIKFSNVKDYKSSIVVMDNLSKGLKYVTGSSKLNGKTVKPTSISEDANGTALVWMQEIGAGKDVELTYDVKVTGETMLVKNNASIQYDNDPVIKLAELKNPLIVTEEKIVIPDTGSNIATISVISGVVLVVTGGYLVYKRYQRNIILK